jgi:hypothetical protein
LRASFIFIGQPVNLVDFDDELNLAKTAAEVWPSERTRAQLEHIPAERS